MVLASRGGQSVAGAAAVPSEPAVDFVRVEANKMPDFVVGHLPFGDETADMANAAVDVLGQLGDVEQLTPVGLIVVGSRFGHVVSFCSFPHDSLPARVAAVRDIYVQKSCGMRDQRPAGTASPI